MTPRETTTTARAYIGLLCAFVLFVSVNILTRAELSGYRIDFTHDKLFTLSKGTHSVISKIDEPITLRFYFSSSLGKEIPALAKYAQRVRDMLNEYAALSNGNIRLEIYDPVAFTDAEDSAVAAGLHGIPLNSSGEQVYFGLSATNSTDDQETIPFFSPDREQFLEYDLSKAVQSLTQPKRKMVGIMSTLPVQGFPGTMMARINPALAQPWQMLTQLRQVFDLKLVDTASVEIPDDVDLLMVIHPADLPPKTMFAIDQFILRGGRALMFVDPLSEVAQQMVGPGAKPIPPTSDLKPIFDAWGINYDSTKAAGDIPAARRVNAGTDARPVPVEYPAWLALTKNNVSPTEPITSELESINMAEAGALSLKPDAKVTMTPLVFTSGNSMLLDAESLKGKPDFFGLLQKFKAGGTPLVFADGVPRRPAERRAEKGRRQGRCCSRNAARRRKQAGRAAEAAGASVPRQVERPDQRRHHRRLRHAAGSLLGQRPGRVRSVRAGPGLQQHGPGLQRARLSQRFGGSDRPARARRLVTSVRARREAPARCGSPPAQQGAGA
jgi:ABC-type uncharacterized transport system involved in gliding motility auxiliary subunit